MGSLSSLTLHLRRDLNRYLDTTFRHRNDKHGVMETGASGGDMGCTLALPCYRHEYTVLVFTGISGSSLGKERRSINKFESQLYCHCTGEI